MKLLALVEAPDHACCRYRVRAFHPALEAAGWRLSFQGLPRGVGGRLSQFVAAAKYDVVLLQRILLPGWQLKLLRRFSRRLVFDFDDAVMYRDSYHRRGLISRRRAARFARTVKSTDTVIAGNDFLAERALACGGRPEQVSIIPTCVAPANYPLAPHEDAQRMQLVWIGSASTLRGLELSRDLWERLGRKVAGLGLRVVCDRFPTFNNLPVVAVLWSEQTEAAEVAAGGAGVSWMPDDLWSRGKCGLKVLQYQAAGLPVLANPVGVHSKMIEPGVSGFLCETAEEWIDAVAALARDPSMRRRMGSAGRARVEADYSVARWEREFVAAISGADERATPAQARLLGVSRRGVPARR